VALNVRLTKTPARYLEALDKPTKRRIKEKLMAIAENPGDSRLSYPLEASEKRSSRVGKYRILFKIEGDDLIVADINSRGQVYRNA
jgi:mRNA-degrading endonuclease RelE of RelBE toxin-antitoxin system